MVPPVLDFKHFRVPRAEQIANKWIRDWIEPSSSIIEVYQTAELNILILQTSINAFDSNSKSENLFCDLWPQLRLGLIWLQCTVLKRKLPVTRVFFRPYWQPMVRRALITLRNRVLAEWYYSGSYLARAISYNIN